MTVLIQVLDAIVCIDPLTRPFQVAPVSSKKLIKDTKKTKLGRPNPVDPEVEKSTHVYDVALAALLSRLGLSFTDPNLARQMTTHKSFDHGVSPTNERLEWLGICFFFIKPRLYRSSSNGGNVGSQAGGC